MNDGLDAARTLLPGVRLKADALLHQTERATVRRVRATDDAGVRTTVIVKTYDPAGEGWLRETSALSVLPTGVAPRLIASGAGVAVLADLGAGPSLADALLGTDPGFAADAVIGWAEALGGIHLASRTLHAEFGRALAERQGDQHADEAPVAVAIDDAVRILDRECGALGVSVPRGALAEIRGLSVRLGPTGAAALTPGDTCPDNNVLVGGRLVLIDFEDAQWRHVAWDVAYLRVPWPTCWCAWHVPDEVVDRAVAAYRAVTADAFAGLDLDADVAAAAVGWAFISLTRILDYALSDDPVPDDPDRPMPGRRPRLLHRLAGAARTTDLPAAAELAGLLRDELRRRWGEQPLPPAPAFRHQ